MFQCQIIKHYVPRTGGRKGGGVALLYKSAISVNLKGSTDSEFTSFEYMLCDIVLDGSLSLCFCVVYRPPPSNVNGLKTSMFHEEWSTFLARVVIRPKDTIIVGDINLHLDVQADYDTRFFMSTLKSCGLKQHVQEATHIHGHTLDVIITGDTSSIVTGVEVTDPGLCDHLGKLSRDHFAVNFTTKFVKPSTTQKVVSFRKLRAMDVEQFKRDIITSSVLQNCNGNLDELVSHYNDGLRSLIDKHAPLRSKTILLRPNSPWYTEDLHDAKHLRRKLERKWKRTKLTIDHQIYRQQCTSVNKLLHQTRRTYYSDKISACGQNPKEIFRIARHLMGEKGSNTVLPQNICAGDLADRFSNFFSRKISDIRDGMQQVECENSPMEETTVEFPLISWRPVAREEIRSIIMKSPDKSCELDPAPTWLLKLCIDDLLPIITAILSGSLNTGYVPKDFRTAMIKPCLKKSGLDPNIFKNYRPVSNLPFMSKILEKVIVSRLESHLVTNNLHEPLQSAYKQFHSTETGLLKVQNDISKALDAGYVNALVMLDLSAAFDTIDHQILLKRFECNFGIHGKALKWISSYLSNRYQTVSIHGELSNRVLLKYGVPQGSVFGPKAYIMYTKPLGDIYREHGLGYHFYADDTQLYLSFKPDDTVSKNYALRKIELCLEETLTWMTKNKLKLNSEKTELILFASKHNQRQVSECSISIGGSTVEAVSHVRNLGVTYDSAMTMEQHVNNICRSAYISMRNIGYIRQYLTKDATRAIVSGLITSRLDYCNALLHGTPNLLLHKLQRIQNSAARIITRTSRHSHITPVLKELHWLPVQCRIEYKILVHTYGALHERAPSYVNDMLVRYRPARPLRSQDSIRVVMPRIKTTTYGNRMFCRSGPVLWNKLPRAVREANSMDMFKTLLKTFLFTNYFNMNV